jgi:hypothetical protein
LPEKQVLDGRSTFLLRSKFKFTELIWWSLD